MSLEGRLAVTCVRSRSVGGLNPPGQGGEPMRVGNDLLRRRVVTPPSADTQALLSAASSRSFDSDRPA